MNNFYVSFNDGQFIYQIKDFELQKNIYNQNEKIPTYQALIINMPDGVSADDYFDAVGVMLTSVVIYSQVEGSEDKNILYSSDSWKAIGGVRSFISYDENGNPRASVQMHVTVDLTR